MPLRYSRRVVPAVTALYPDALKLLPVYSEESSGRPPPQTTRVEAPNRVNRPLPEAPKPSDASGTAAPLRLLTVLSRCLVTRKNSSRKACARTLITCSAFMIVPL